MEHRCSTSCVGAVEFRCSSSTKALMVKGWADFTWLKDIGSVKTFGTGLQTPFRMRNKGGAEMVESEKGCWRLLENMPQDEEITGRFYWQARQLLGDDFSMIIRNEKQREKFADVLLDTMLKCHAMQYHKEMYRLVEKDYFSLIENNGDGWYRSYHMLFELEAFLFELKSALDIGVKVLNVFFPQRFKTHTFGDKGGHIIAGLVNYKKDKDARVEVVDDLIKLLCDDRDVWLMQAITLRDTLSHYRTFAQFNYNCTRNSDNKSIVLPKVAGLEPNEYLALAYKNCIEFLQDFIFLVVYLFLPKNWHIGVRDKGHPAIIGEPLSQYIKYGLGISDAMRVV